MGTRQSLSPVACCCQPCKVVAGGTCLDGFEEEAGGALDFAQVTSLSVISWGPGSAPAGKLFEETLQHLPRLDRHLLLFSSSSSLAAVRWLHRLGASWDVCDTNCSSCLHAACRTGSLSVVTELIRHQAVLEAIDSANWTPLHIAAHMGRRKVVLQLLRARASPHRRNSEGQTPIQLCLDHGTREALAGGYERSHGTPRPPAERHGTARPRPRLLVAQLAATAEPTGGEPAGGWGEDDDDDEACGEGDLGREEVEDQRRPAWGPNEAAGGRAGGEVGQEGGAPVRRVSAHHLSSGESEEEEEDRVGVPLQCEPELFFVTPSPVVKHVGFYKKALLQLAVRIFNLHPSYGVGFAVLSGLSDNYTGAMKALLRAGEVSREMAGSFLGDALSVCHLIRFGVLDSLAFLHTSVVSAMTLAFRSFQLPNDLQKVHRLVHSVAVVWWRKHRALAREGFEPQKGWCESGHHELAGLGLLQYLASSDVLSQLMLSTLLLHWHLHGDKSRPGRNMPLEEWLALNQGIEEGGTNVPEFVQQQIYTVVSRRQIPELTCSPLGSAAWSSCTPAASSSAPSVCQEELKQASEAAQEGTEAAGDLKLAEAPAESALHPLAIMEGWLQLLGGALPCPARARAVDGDLGELTMSTWSEGLLDPCIAGGPDGGASGRMAALAAALPAAPGPASEGFVWASLCCVFLLFALSPAAGSAAAAPHVVADARRLKVARLNPEQLLLRLEGAPLQGHPTSPRGRGDSRHPDAFQVALLLPDGRWRELTVNHLEVRVQSLEELRRWESAIARTRASTCKI